MKRYNPFFCKILLMVSIMFLYSCFSNNKTIIECGNTIKSTIVFSNFEFGEIENVKIQYRDSINETIDILIYHDLKRYNKENKTVFSTKNLFLLKNVEYTIVTQKDTFYLNIDSIGVQYQNTMFSKDQICGVKQYSINDVKYDMNYLLVDKNLSSLKD